MSHPLVAGTKMRRVAKMHQSNRLRRFSVTAAMLKLRQMHSENLIQFSGLFHGLFIVLCVAATKGRHTRTHQLLTLAHIRVAVFSIFPLKARRWDIAQISYISYLHAIRPKCESFQAKLRNSEKAPLKCDRFSLWICRSFASWGEMSTHENTTNGIWLPWRSFARPLANTTWHK